MRLKRNVTELFRERKLRLRSISGGALRNDDFLELFVLVRAMCVLSHGRHVSVENLDAGTFVVAASPSPHWDRASYFLVSGEQDAVRLRTGLEVTASDGETVEIDVVVVAADRSQGTTGEQVFAGFECKAHARRPTADHANGIIGKAARVWGLPVPLTGEATRYTLVSLLICSEHAKRALAMQAIGACALEPPHSDDLETLLQAFARALFTPGGPSSRRRYG